MLLQYKDWKKIYESNNSEKSASFLTVDYLGNYASALVGFDLTNRSEGELKSLVESINSKIPDFTIEAPLPGKIEILLPEKYLENDAGLTKLEVNLSKEKKQIYPVLLDMSEDRYNYGKQNRPMFLLKSEYTTGNIKDQVLKHVIDHVLEKKWTTDSIIKEIDETLEDVGISIAVGGGFYRPEAVSRELSDLFSKALLAMHLEKELFTSYIKIDITRYEFDEISKKAERLTSIAKEKLTGSSLSNDDMVDVTNALLYLLNDLRKMGGKFTRIADPYITSLIPYLNRSSPDTIRALTEIVSKK